MSIIVLGEVAGGSILSGDDEDDAMDAIFGAGKEVIRQSEALVEAAFDGDIDEVQSQLDKGYHPESCDEHDQVVLCCAKYVRAK